jgi:SPP1 family predicted phage head-tail adaptor
VINSLKERISIIKSETVIDDNGNHTLEWIDCFSCFAYVNNLSGSEYYEAAKINMQNEIHFIVRYCSELKNIDCEHYRIVFRGKLYNITFVDNVMYQNKTLKLKASLVER